jgi:hypothetical protein
MSLELICASIRQTVEKHGDTFKRAAPSAITISLVGAALLPVALGTLPVTWPMLAMLGLAGGVGQGLLGNWLTEFVGRMAKERQAKAITEDEIRARLENELRARWETGGAGAESATWRMEISQMLQKTGGMDTALSVATTDVKQSMALSFQALSQEFQEFGWFVKDMAHSLADISAQQGQQIDLLRQILQTQQENALQAGAGLQALGDLIQRSSQMRAALFAFRADETALDDLQDYLLGLEDILVQLRAVTRRAAVTASDTAWISDVAGARDGLRQVTEQADAKLLKQAIWRLNRTLSIQPTCINTRLTAAARALRLPALAEALAVARDHLAAPGLDVDKVRQFQSGLDSPGRGLQAQVTDNPVKTRRAFRNYRNRAGHHFFQVDSELRKLCSGRTASCHCIADCKKNPWPGCKGLPRDGLAFCLPHRQRLQAHETGLRRLVLRSECRRSST